MISLRKRGNASFKPITKLSLCNLLSSAEGKLHFCYSKRMSVCHASIDIWSLKFEVGGCCRLGLISLNEVFFAKFLDVKSNFWRQAVGGSRGGALGARLPLFLHQTEVRKAEKIFWRPGLPLISRFGWPGPLLISSWVWILPLVRQFALMAGTLQKKIFFRLVSSFRCNKREWQNKHHDNFLTGNHLESKIETTNRL